ncbi:MAG: hypothetical protein FJ096_22220 [Deltaproteobacteria bacterium]|nr:hypothetical protein [Deltaproteobacteria bacterium]
MSSSTGIGGGGTGGDGGQACVPACAGRECGPDGCGGLCGACSDGTCDAEGLCCPDTWALRVPAIVRHLATSPEGSRLYVGDEAGDVRSLRTCDGKVAPNTASLVETMSTRIAAVRQTTGLVHAVGTGNGAIKVHTLDPKTLAIVGAPVEVASTSGKNVFGVELDQAGRLWLGVHEDGGLVVRVAPGKPPCTMDLDASPTLTMGLASTPSSLVLALLSPFNSTTTVRRYPWSGIDAEACSFTASASDDAALGTVVNGMASEGERVFVAQLGGNPSGNVAAILSRHDPGGADVSVTLDVTPTLDGFMSVAATPQAVYVGGVAGGLYTRDFSIASGEAWVWRYDSAFDGASSPKSSTEVPGGRVAMALTVGASGVYVAGQSSDGAGFVVKCTTALACPTVPGPN